MFLTFSKDQFILVQPNEKVETKIIRSSLWTPIHSRILNSNVYATKDIKAAAKFRRIADDKAEKIFNRVLVKHYTAPLAPLPDFLDSHQIDGVKWILTRSRAYLAHAPGAGKTAEAIVASLLAEGNGQTLFIVPPTLTINWAREILKWTEWRGVFPTIAILPKSEEKDTAGWDAEFLICPDSMLTKSWVLDGLKAREFKLIAVDEASRFKEATASRTIALFGGKYRVKTGKKTYRFIESPGIIQNAKHAVLLDGSPMPNRPMELWAPVYAMAPEAIDFMSQSDFGFRYCGAKMNSYGQWEFKGAANHEELHAKLKENFMHVVTENELSHPERLRSMVFMTEDPRSIAQKTWERKHLSKINFSDIDDDMADGDLARFRQELGLDKVPWVANYVKEKIATGESVLLFAWHREVCLRYRKAFGKMKPGIVFGGTLPKEREYYFKRFQDGKDPLLILNIAAGGRGHNLQRADRIVFGEFSWTDETNKQCEKRASRKGSDKVSVPCDYIVATNSLDEPVLNAVFTKARNVERVIG